MTREEAIEYFKMKVSAREAIGNDIGADYEAYQIALSALRPVSRERVEKVWRGEWKCHGDCGVTECSACGWNIEEYVGDYNFCPVCGAPMTDEAMQMVMERLEALYETT